MLATDIRPGDRVTYCGYTFAAAAAEHEPIPDLIRVDVPGEMPQYIAPFRQVTIHNRCRNCGHDTDYPSDTCMIHLPEEP